MKYVELAFIIMQTKVIQCLEKDESHCANNGCPNDTPSTPVNSSIAKHYVLIRQKHIYG